MRFWRSNWAIWTTEIARFTATVASSAERTPISLYQSQSVAKLASHGREHHRKREKRPSIHELVPNPQSLIPTGSGPPRRS